MVDDIVYCLPKALLHVDLERGTLNKSSLIRCILCFSFLQHIYHFLVVKIGKLIKYISFRSPMKGKNLDEEVQTDSPKRSRWRIVPIGAIITVVLSLGAYRVEEHTP